jgi:hypothetical protein
MLPETPSATLTPSNIARGFDGGGVKLPGLAPAERAGAERLLVE